MCISFRWAGSGQVKTRLSEDGTSNNYLTTSNFGTWKKKMNNIVSEIILTKYSM